MAVILVLMPIGRVVVGVVLLLLACASRPLRSQQARFEFAQVHMGMEVRLVLYAGESAQARSAAAAAFDRIRKLEDTMSDYRDESEVRRLVLRPGEWVPVSPDLCAVLAEALALAERSDGAFDPTAGPLVTLWRQARRTGRLPSPESIGFARARVGWRLVELRPDRCTVRLSLSGMVLDLGGLAKGYILDRALETARANNVGRVLITAGGDIVAGEPPPGRAGWRIELDGASPEMRKRAATLANVALSTSGDGEQFAVINGVRYSHVVDPRTGWPLTNRRQSYVIARSGMVADGLATALTGADSMAVSRLLGFYPGVHVEVIRRDSSATPGSHPSRSVPSFDQNPPR